MIAASFAGNSTSLGDLFMALPERAWLRNCRRTWRACTRI
jgi:hypothetical protein